MDRFPLLPLEEKGRLNELPLRENPIERVLGLRQRATTQNKSSCQ